MFLLSKTSKLKVVNSVQTTFRLTFRYSARRQRQMFASKAGVNRVKHFKGMLLALPKNISLGWQGSVFNFRSGRMRAVNLCCCEVKQPNLKLSTQPKQLLGFLLLDIGLQDRASIPVSAIFVFVIRDVIKLFTSIIYER